MVDSDRFLFTDNSIGDEIGDGFILLKRILDDIKPKTVINVQDLEEILASATLQKCEKNVREIRHLKPGTY